MTIVSSKIWQFWPGKPNFALKIQYFDKFRLNNQNSNKSWPLIQFGPLKTGYFDLENKILLLKNQVFGKTKILTKLDLTSKIVTILPLKTGKIDLETQFLLLKNPNLTNLTQKTKKINQFRPSIQNGDNSLSKN